LCRVNIEENVKKKKPCKTTHYNLYADSLLLTNINAQNTFFKLRPASRNQMKGRITQRQCKCRGHRVTDVMASTRGRATWLQKSSEQIEIPIGDVSVVTLKRTDTTHDLSQEAKRAGGDRSLFWVGGSCFIYISEAKPSQAAAA